MTTENTMVNHAIDNDSFAVAQDSKYNNIMQKVALWGSFYRANPTRFIKEYFGIRCLKTFQEIWITEMWDAVYIFDLACRGISKTWTTALFASTKCVLYPGTAVIVASATRKQARELVGKIEKDFMINYPMFALEVEKIENNQYSTIVRFRCGSTIEVVTASETARCGRGNLLIVDECRLVDKYIIDSVLKKFLTAQRHAGYMDLDKYKNLPLERNQQIYLTSGWYANHWCFNLFKDFAAGMIAGNRDYFAAALPYQLSIKERLLDRRDVEAEMLSTDFNEISWAMEMEAVFFSGSDGSLYRYDEISPCRRIEYAFYPSELSVLLPDKRIRIPQKMHNENRILSVDLALMQSSGKSGNNDATSAFLNRQLMNDNGGRSKKQIVYAQNYEGLRAEDQALRIRRLFYDFDGDWLIIDARGLGLPIVDMLMADMYDSARGITYPALGCFNNEEINKRCKVRNAPKKIWAMMATSDINSQCALTLREEFKQGNIELLLGEEDFDEIFSQVAGFNKLGLEDKLRFKAPYMNTTLTINELINLETEVKGNYVKVKEKAGNRKDRFSSLSYNIWLANQLEKEYVADKAQRNIQDVIFQFRQPNIGKRF